MLGAGKNSSSWSYHKAAKVASVAMLMCAPYIHLNQIADITTNGIYHKSCQCSSCQCKQARAHEHFQLSHAAQHVQHNIQMSFAVQQALDIDLTRLMSTAGVAVSPST